MDQFAASYQPEPFLIPSQPDFDPPTVPTACVNKRKSVRATPVQVQSSTDASLEFKLLTHILQTERRARVGGKMKMVKVDPLKFGPIMGIS